MPEARDVYGEEAVQARQIRREQSCDVEITHDPRRSTTRFYRVTEPLDEFPALVRGWYEISPNASIILHWTNKADVLREIGALLRTD